MVDATDLKYRALIISKLLKVSSQIQGSLSIKYLYMRTLSQNLNLLNEVQRLNGNYLTSKVKRESNLQSLR